MAKFISLFAGVGGFDLGMEKAGHECVAQVEWDKNAAGVLKHRWPNVPLFCDVSKVSADDLPDADFITYGFPCQDLSVVGKREGLEGDRSGLFFEATRLIRELIARGSGLRFAVAENVAGLFSADDGVALARCIRELLDCGACETGWALLDSQYFGVAQRRKRVFIVSDFGGESVDEILAITESLPGHPAPSREAGQGTAGDATKGVGESGKQVICRASDQAKAETSVDQAPTLNSNHGVGGQIVAHGADKNGVAYEQEGIAFEPKSLDDPPRVTGDIKKVVSPSLNCMTGGGREPAVVSWNGDTTPKASEDVSVTLRSQQGGEGVGVAFQQNSRDEVRLIGGDGKTAGALCAESGMKQQNYIASQQGGEGVGVAFHASQDPIHSEEHTPALGSNATIGVTTYEWHNQDSRIREPQQASTLSCNAGGKEGNLVQENLTVRRLTPIEC